MKNLIFLIILTIFLFSCSIKDEDIELTKESPEYNFAKSLTKNLPSLDPDSNRILISTNQFNITTGTVTKALYKNFYTKLDQLKNLSGVRLKKIFVENADLLGKKTMLLKAADNVGLKIPDTEIDSTMQLEYTKAGGKEKYIEYLSKNGISLNYVKEDHYNSLLIKKYLENAVAHLTEVSESEINEKLMEFRTASVRHILLKTNDKNESEKNQIRKKMENLLEKIKKGEKFSELARKYSEDTGSKKNGGLVKNIKKGDMVKAFEDVAFSIPIGGISDIFETNFGFHVLKVIDRKKDTRSAAQIKSELQKAKQNKEIPTYIEQLKTEFEFTIVEF